MKNVIAGVVAGLFVVACGGGSTPNQPEDEHLGSGNQPAGIFDLPYLMRDLENGLRVIVVRTDYPDIVSLQIPVQTGSRNEVEPGKSGFAHFFEHMMFRGTEKYPADRYLGVITQAGADNNAYTTDDYTNYHMTFTRDDLEKMLEIEADRFRNLSYSEENFRTEALAVKGEYLKNFSDPTSKMYERLRALGFTNHTYSHTTMGFIEDIEAMPDQLEYSKVFFDRWYRPEKATVIVVGDVDPENTYELVRKYWGGWERGDYEADIPVEPPFAGPVYEHYQWDGPTQPWLMVGFRGPAYRPTEKDMPAMDLLASIYFSDSSDIYRKLVLEDQSVDQLLTYFPDRKDPSILLIYARLTDEKYMASVEQAINDALVTARTELLDAAKVEDTKSRLRYSFVSQLDNSVAIGDMLAGFVQFFRTPETINEVYRSYDALTAEDIRDYANRYFNDAGRVTLSLSNSAAIAGVDGMTSIDELVAVAGMTTPAHIADTSVGRPRPPDIESRHEEPVPVNIVAQSLAASPLVDVSFIVHAGAGMDPAGKKGLASLTAAMISDAGSSLYSIQEINTALHPMAAGFSAQVDKEMTRLSGQVHKDNLDDWYALISGQLLSPGWRDQDFERTRTQLVNAIRTGLVGNNDEELAKELLYTELYGAGHPYGSLNLGAIEDIESLTIEDVQRFYNDYYTINNITVGLSGGFDDAFATRLSNDLQALPAGERAALEMPAAPMPNGRNALIVEKETPAVAVSFGFPIELARGDPDWIALWLARSYLGEHRNSNSHLYKRIREARGMNYGDYAYVEYYPRGMFRTQPNTNLGRQQQIFQVWVRPLRSNNDAHFATRTAQYELEKLIRDGLSETDFESTRSFLSKYVSLMTDGQSRQLGYDIDSQYYEIDNFADYIRAGLDELTLDDVNRVIRENLDTRNMQYVFVTRDAGDLQERLASDRSSPMHYDADKPADLLAEDREIESLSLGFEEGTVKIVSSDAVFR